MSTPAEPGAEQTDNTDPEPVDPTSPTEEEQPAPEEPTPPAPDLPPAPVVFEPGMFYAVESVCTTEDTGDGTPCPNLNTTTTEPEIYSNAGNVIMICGLCGKQRPILSAVKLDPQPDLG